jgi:uncharacterized damage-inducible protein DinB
MSTASRLLALVHPNSVADSALWRGIASVGEGRQRPVFEEAAVAVGDLQDDRRTEPDFDLAEREMLEGWLEFHRITLLMKCEGLDDDGRKARPVATSKLSLHGLIRHMAEVERSWFQSVVAGESITALWDAVGGEYADFHVEDADPEEAFTLWRAACDRSRVITDAVGSLDETVVYRGEMISLRYVLTHLIEEYARHNGHADLLREAIDGAVGE